MCGSGFAVGWGGDGGGESVSARGWRARLWASCGEISTPFFVMTLGLVTRWVTYRGRRRWAGSALESGAGVR